MSATKYPEVFAALAAPFEKGEVKQRQGGRGMTLSYITARSVQNRLDMACGPENWRDEFFESREGLRCRLWLRMPDGEWIAKEDGGAAADMGNADDTEKSAYSHAFKRAAVKWGVGRYLYQDGVPDFSGNGHAAPAARPAPARPTGTAAGLSPDGAAQKLRNQLWAQIKMICGQEKPAGDAVSVALGAIAEKCGGELIESIRECEDTALLARSCDAAREIVAEGLGI